MNQDTLEKITSKLEKVTLTIDNKEVSGVAIRKENNDMMFVAKIGDDYLLSFIQDDCQLSNAVLSELDLISIPLMAKILKDGVQYD